MAPLSPNPFARAQAIKDDSRRLREQAAANRRVTRDGRRAYQTAMRNLSAGLERHRHASMRLGTWPYYAPATRELLKVLVVPPEG
jgi:hypothetical protein